MRIVETAGLAQLFGAVVVPSAATSSVCILLLLLVKIICGDTTLVVGFRCRLVGFEICRGFGVLVLDGLKITCSMLLEVGYQRRKRPLTNTSSSERHNGVSADSTE